MEGLDQIAQLGTGERGVAEVVVGSDERAPANRSRLGIDSDQLDRPQLGKGGRHAYGKLGDWLHAGRDRTVAVPVARGWQNDQTVSCHGQQGDPCRHGRGSPVVSQPAERKTCRLGDRGAGRQLDCERADEFEVFLGKVPAAVANAQSAGLPGASRQSRRSSSLAAQGRKRSSAWPSGGRPPHLAQASR